MRIRVHFCSHDLNPTRAEPGLDAGFVFLPVGALEIWKKTQNPKETRNPKKLKTWKNPKRNLKKPWKKPIYKTRRVPEPNPTPDGFRCQISPVGSSSGAKFHPWVRVRVTNLTRLHFFSQWYLTQWSRGGLYEGHRCDDLVIKRRRRPFQRGAPLDIQNGSDFTVATDNDCLSLLCSSVAYSYSLLQAHHFYWR
jgi:hypothetical protein